MTKPDKQVQPVEKKKKRKGKDDLNELKKEVQMDEHKIPLQELVQRLETDTCKVELIINIFNCAILGTFNRSSKYHFEA
jgi:hypothetical protein